jgi:hypothetical protein
LVLSGSNTITNLDINDGQVNIGTSSSIVRVHAE